MIIIEVMRTNVRTNCTIPQDFSSPVVTVTRTRACICSRLLRFPVCSFNNNEMCNEKTNRPSPLGCIRSGNELLSMDASRCKAINVEQNVVNLIAKNLFFSHSYRYVIGLLLWNLLITLLRAEMINFNG